MEAVFFRLLNLSLMASLMVVVVLILRLLLRKAPKWIFCALWGLVALRLLIPVSIESRASLMPTAEPIPYSAVQYTPVSPVQPVLPLVTETVTPAPVAPQPVTPSASNTVAAEVPALSVMDILPWVWLAGVLAMLGYGLGSYGILHRRLRTAVRDEDNLWLSDRIESPFVLGLFRPRIYLPFRVKGAIRAHVLAHEQAHIRRRDHWWKPLGFALLAVYWFNPLLWVAYILLCRDIEAACDEKVIADMDADARKDYSYALLSCAVRSRRIAACPLAFGEEGVKGRVKRVMSYKKPTFWIILLAIIAILVTAVCLLTVPKAEEPETPTQTETQTEPEEPEITPNDNIMHLPDGEAALWFDEETAPHTQTGRHVPDVTLAEYPDVSFWFSESGSKDVVWLHHDDNTSDALFIGDVQAAWFADLNEDGKRELILSRTDTASARACITICVPETGKAYTLSRNGIPFLRDGKLLVDCFSSPFSDITSSYTCRIIYENGKFVLVSDFNGDLYDVAAPVDENATRIIENAGTTLCFDYTAPSSDGSFKLAEVKGCEFYVDASVLTVTRDGQSHTLVYGMPIWKVYLSDLNGDGIREVCVSSSFGSGIVDERVTVYDPAANAYAELSDRGITDFSLSVDGDCRLVLNNRLYGADDSPAVSTILTLADGKLCWDSADGQQGTASLYPLPKLAITGISGYSMPANVFADPVLNGLTLDEFPGVSFLALTHNVFAARGNDTSGKYKDILFNDPDVIVDSVWFVDLTGDDKREVCISLTDLTGRMYVQVIDYANHRQAMLRDQEHDISLTRELCAPGLWFATGEHPNVSDRVEYLNSSEVVYENDALHLAGLSFPFQDAKFTTLPVTELTTD